jgi:cytochrome P450
MLPPGPTGPPAAVTAAFVRDPLGALTRARSAYGPVFTLPLAVAGPTVVVADPSAVAPLMHGDPDIARAGEARRRSLPFASPWSSFGGDGSDHQGAKERLRDAFTAEVLARREPAMAALGAEHAARWPRRRPIRLLPRLRTLLDDVFVGEVLGVREPELRAPLVLAIRRMLNAPGNPPLPLPGEGNRTAVMPASAFFALRRGPVEQLLERAFEARRARPDGDGALCTMLRVDPGRGVSAMADELLPVIMAAQEPPSIALAWLIDRLGRHRTVRERFLAAPPGDPYRDAVIRETLRLQSPSLGVMRRLSEPFEVAGHRLEPGTVVMLPIPLLQRDPSAFDQPAEFRPERWSGDVDETTYVPFGGGARRCLGEHLAHAYFRAVLPAILGRARIRPLWPRPERMVERGTVLVPHRSLLATVRDA